MTTVVFKDGIMCTDSRLTQGDRIIGNGKKIYTRGDLVVGLCGNFTGIQKFIYWLFSNDAAFPEGQEILDTAALVWNKKTKKLVQYEGTDTAIHIVAPFHAIGSGSSYALGALAMGATVEEAITVAAQFDVNTDDNLQVVQ